jgi:hypothetical protein
MSSEADIPTEKKLQDTYRKAYLMQAVGTDGNTIRTSVPRQVVEKEARRLSLTVKEFLELYKLEWLYNGFPGVYGTFIPIKKEKQVSAKD